jgi:hypothetical protein
MSTANQLSTSNQMTQQDRRADKANTLVGMVIGCVLLAVGGFLLLQNTASVKLPDNNQAWAGAWKKKLSKHWEMPKAEGQIDWSDPKYDMNKVGEQSWAKENPIFQQIRDQQGPNNFTGR